MTWGSSLNSGQLGIDVLLTDFERTLGRLFEQPEAEREVYKGVLDIYAHHDLPLEVRQAAGESPYSLWTEAYQWITEHARAGGAEALNQVVGARLTYYEVEAAESFRLLEGVQAVLERLRSFGIRVAVVSNNSVEAVERALKANKVEGLVDHVLGRRNNFRMQDLKPSPALVLEALEHFGCAADAALLVGDSVVDMAAGRAAGVGLTVGVVQHSTASRTELRRAGARIVLSRFSDLEPLILGTWHLDNLTATSRGARDPASATTTAAATRSGDAHCPPDGSRRHPPA
jgi:HAD superfamily hydrolase (TIGR01662 family)